MRDDLAKSAATVCEPPPKRPPHAAKTRDVNPRELDAALLALCEAQHAHVAAPDAAAVLHEALLADRAYVGEARRSNLLLGGSTTNCDVTFATLDQVLLATPTLERCADVVAVARDQDLAGDVTDLLFANTMLQHAVETCMPLVAKASREDALRFHTAIVTLRTTFPEKLDDAVRRDHAEVVLLHFGQAQAPGTPPSCDRATKYATSTETKPMSPADLLAAWHAQTPTPDADLEKYRTAYALTLAALDRLVSLSALPAAPGAPAP